MFGFGKKKKIAKAIEAQRRYELEQAAKPDDVGHFGVVRDHAVGFNPLATGEIAALKAENRRLEATAKQADDQKLEYQVVTELTLYKFHSLSIYTALWQCAYIFVSVHCLYSSSISNK